MFPGYYILGTCEGQDSPVIEIWASAHPYYLEDLPVEWSHLEDMRMLAKI